MTRPTTGSRGLPWSDWRPLNSPGRPSMATPVLPPDFKEFLQLLNSNGVEYLLIGGYAVGYYGYVRATADMDIWVALNVTNAARATYRSLRAATRRLECPPLARTARRGEWEPYRRARALPPEHQHGCRDAGSGAEIRLHGA